MSEDIENKPEKKGRFLRRAFTVLLVVAVFIGAIFALRGPFISNYLKRTILHELEDITGRQVIAQKIYLNLFPLFIGADGIKAFDEEGVRLLTADSVKVYIGLDGIARREITLNRILVDKGGVWTNADDVKDIISRSRASIENGKPGKKKPFFKIIPKTAELRDIEAAYSDKDAGIKIEGNSIGVNIIFSDTPEVWFDAPELKATLDGHPGLPPFKARARGGFVIGKDGITIRSVKAKSFGSELSAFGNIDSENRMGMASKSLVLMSSIKEMFGLAERGEGRVKLDGTIKTKEGFKNPEIDMKADGDFYLESLMELLGVKVEQGLSGYLKFEGRLKGPLKDLKASGKAEMKDGVIYGVKIDRLLSEVSYAKNTLSFTNAKGKLYGGSGTAEFSMDLPKVEAFTLKVEAQDIDSAPIVELIGLADLPVGPGKAAGALYTKGAGFNPYGWFKWRGLKPSGDALGRLEAASGAYRLKDREVILRDVSLATAASKVLADAVFKLDTDVMEIAGRAETGDIKDLTAPYLDSITGSAEALFKISGSLALPKAEAIINGSGIKYKDFEIGAAHAEASYAKEAVVIREFVSASDGGGIRASGKIGFPESGKAFDFRSPDYDVMAEFTDADLKTFLSALGMDAPVGGRFDTKALIKGQRPVISGPAKITGLKAYMARAEMASFDYVFDMTYFNVSDAVFRSGGSKAFMEGRVGLDRSFGMGFYSERLLLSDFLMPDVLPFDYLVSIVMEGEGTFDDPSAKLTAELKSGMYKGVKMEDGFIDASLVDKNLKFDAWLFGRTMTLGARALLEGDMPWSADVKLENGRYDFLLAALLKETPEDLLFGLSGNARLSGTKDTINADGKITQAIITMYGEGFTNQEDISFGIRDRGLEVTPFRLESGHMAIRAGGKAEIGGPLDVSIDGTASLAPLAGFSDAVEVVRGNAEFVFNIKGAWDAPVLTGGLKLKDGTLGLKAFPQRITDINGYLYVSENMLTLEALRAKLGGGEMEIAGMAEVENLSLRSFYADAAVRDVTLFISKDFHANLGGNLLLRKRGGKYDVTGDIRVNRANYAKRLEWKTWLLAARRESVAPTETWMDSIGLNIKVNGDRNIIADNNIIIAPLKVDMLVQGTMGHPKLFGRLEAGKGKMFFRNHEFRIVRATVDYADLRGENPYFNVVAETFVSGYHISLTLDGELDRFTLALNSDPPLDDAEILALLTVGEFGEGLSGMAGGVGAAEATAFLTGKYQDVLEERFRNITGLDRLTVDPYVSETGDVAPRITASKKLAGERLFVTYSTAVGAEDDILKLEYVVAENISLVGSRDDAGGFGGDVKFRFHFK